MVAQNSLNINVLQNKHIHTGLDILEDEYMMTVFGCTVHLRLVRETGRDVF